MQIKNNMLRLLNNRHFVTMFFLMILVFFSVIKRQIGIYTSVLLIMSIFVDFNSVLFLQYFCWVVPFIPLAILEMVATSRQNNSKETC
jgi:hypothetical protein